MRQRALLVAVLVCLVVAPVAHATPLAPVGGHETTVAAASPAGAPFSSDTGAISDDDIRLTTTLALTPAQPGAVAVTLRFEVPDSVVDLETTLTTRAEAVSTEGFTAAGDGTYEWDGDTATATISYTLPANRTTTTGRLHPDLENSPPSRAVAEAGEGYLFVDTGPWALVATPSPSVAWRYRGDRVDLQRTATTDGPGAVGGRVAFLGEHTVSERTDHGQTLRLVVPAAANEQLAVSQSAILSSLASASASLRVGDRDETVFLVAAPTGVDWAVRGLQTGDADAWVRADEPLDDAQSPWIHEYVHTRQAFTPTEETKWIIEGSADYYAALLALQQGRIDFAAFARHLEQGARAPYDDDVLADQSTWTVGTPYRKGSLVAGDLDRRIRLAGDGATFATVLRRLNAEDGPVSGERFRSLVSAAGGDATGDAARRFTRTEAAPQMWSSDAHEAAFDAAVARVSVTAPSRVTTAGPYRNTTLATPATLAVGETLTVPVDVANTGDAAGDYRVALAVDGRTVSTANGSIPPGANTTERLSWVPETAGTHTMTIRDRTYEIRVRDPVEPTISSLTVNRTRVTAGERVLLTASVAAPGDVPAEGVVAVAVDGQRTSSQRVRVAPGESVTLRVPIDLDGPGERTLSVGDARVSLTVERPAAADVVADSASQLTEVPVGGFGVVVAAAALLAAAALAVGRGRRGRSR